MARYGLTLRARLALAVSLLLLCALVPLNLFQRYSMTERLHQQIHATLQVEAEGLRDLVEATLTEREANARSWSEDSLLRDALRSEAFEKSDGVLAALRRHHPSFLGLVLFTQDGRAVSASEPRLRDAFAGRRRDVLDAPWFRAAQEGRLDTSTLAHEDPIFQRRVLPFAVPVNNPINGARIGVLLAAYDWGHVGSVVSAALQRSRARGLRSFALEVRTADGAVLYDSRPAGAPRVDSPVQAEATDSDAVHDVGDGWRFAATVDPDEAYAPLERAETVALLLTGLSILLAGLGAWVLAHGMTRPLSTLSEVVGRIVREGDLTQQVQVPTRRDEVGELASAFSRMMSHLRESTASLQQGTRVLGQTVADLTRAAAEEERNLTRQAAALQETQLTAQEIKQTSMMAADRSQAVLDATERAREVSAAGEATVGASLQGFEQLREQVGRVAGSISALAERTRQIDGITQTVKELADQSNMLALNAAIEAVLSGEHGRGFGVVAREIRGLADQSIDATGRVREILQDIRRGIQATVALSEEGQRRTEVGLAQVRASGDSLRELAGIIQDNASAAQQIAIAVTQQSAGVAQIFTAVTDLSRMMEETMQGLKGTQRTTEALREVARRMEQVASAYRV
jgi:methyl-accepting chemotaxis protein